VDAESAEDAEDAEKSRALLFKQANFFSFLSVDLRFQRLQRPMLLLVCPVAYTGERR
jgi:hypothetical protein